jgi:hypothetical protein
MLEQGLSPALFKAEDIPFKTTIVPLPYQSSVVPKAVKVCRSRDGEHIF